MDPAQKRCVKCNIFKNPEDFYVRKAGRVETRCKECVKVYSTKRYSQNKPQLKAQQKAYYEKNKARIIAKTSAYRRAHPEIAKKSWQKWYLKNKPKEAAKARKWRLANRDRALLNGRRWRWLNPEKAAKLRRDWRKANPEKRIAHSLKATRLRVLRYTNAPGNFSEELWRQRLELLGAACWYCGKESGVTVEHVIPLARGGTNYIANLRPTCKKCNNTKGVKTYKEFMEYLLLKEFVVEGESFSA